MKIIVKKGVVRRFSDSGDMVEQPNAHYIPRSHGGLGVEQNIITLCPTCHYRFDQTTERAGIKEYIASYLREACPSWNEQDLYYRKGMDL